MLLEAYIKDTIQDKCNVNFAIRWCFKCNNIGTIAMIIGKYTRQMFWFAAGIYIHICVHVPVYLNLLFYYFNPNEYAKLIWI